MIRKEVFWLLIAACSLLGMVIVLLITSQGVATWTDSGHYFGAAWSMVAGDELRNCYGAIFNRWPPLYPALLAAPMKLGFAPLDAARLVNVIAFGLTILGSGWLYYVALRSKALAILGTLAVALSWPQTLWAVHALSETVFTLLLVLFIALLARFSSQPTRRTFVFMVIAAALAALQRYLGVAAFMVGGLGILLFTAAPLVTRIRYAFLFGLCASIPLLFWVLRNQSLTGDPTGTRLSWSLADMLNNFALFTSPMLDWIIPQRIDTGGTLTGSPLLDAALFIGVCVLVIFIGSRQSKSLRVIGAGLLFFAIYTIVVQLSASLVNFRNDAGRVAAPLYPLFALIVLCALGSAARFVDTRTSRQVGSVVTALFVAGWLILPAEKIWREVNGLTRSDGWTGFSTLELRTSLLVAWQQPEQIIEPLFSNKATTLCIHGGLAVQPISPTDAELAQQRMLESEFDVLTLIILPDSAQFEMQYSVEEFSDTFDIERLVSQEGETGIYRMTRND